MTGETKWRVERRDDQVVICRDWYENGVLGSPQHVEFVGGKLKWVDHEEGAEGLPWVRLRQVADAVEAGEL